MSGHSLSVAEWTLTVTVHYMTSQVNYSETRERYIQSDCRWLMTASRTTLINSTDMKLVWRTRSRAYSRHTDPQGAFFNSFRKGPVVCRGLDIDLSGKIAKKWLWHGKEVATPTMLLLRTKSAAEHGWGSSHCVYSTHINVAIVTRSHFRNAKPKFHMNCLPTISINDRGCQQRCMTRPANILTCTYSFNNIFTIYKSTGKQQRNAHSYSYLYTHSET